jgi:hypothetical protein
MSASLAAAKKRRANIQEPSRVGNSSVPENNMPAPPIASGLTLPQVIQIVDNRLIVLEKFMRETKDSGVQQKTVSFTDDAAAEESSSPIDISEVIEEFDNRYKLLAEEIANLKNIVLSLQSYTMEVNKTLLEERVRIFSDLDKDITPTLTEN